jgi:hypothetical protein
MERRTLLWLLSVVCLLSLVPAAVLAQGITVRTDPEECLECWIDREEIRFLAL